MNSQHCKLDHLFRNVLVPLVFFLSLTSNTQALLITSTVANWTDPFSGGSIQVRSELFDNYIGDFSIYEWRYTVTNTSYDPTPGISNGLSGFNIVFPQDILELGNQFGPVGWAMNCCTSGPPNNAEWDIDNSAGFGIPIGGSAIFGFTTDPRYSLITEESWMHSWEFDIQTSTFSGPLLVPGLTIPEPATLALIGFGLAGLGLSRIRRRNVSG